MWRKLKTCKMDVDPHGCLECLLRQTVWLFSGNRHHLLDSLELTSISAPTALRWHKSRYLQVYNYLYLTAKGAKDARQRLGEDTLFEPNLFQLKTLNTILLLSG